MKFLARFIGSAAKGEYFRVVFADDVNEATKAAERFCRKGYILSTVRAGDMKCGM